MQMGIRIKAIDYYLPDRIVTNEELHKGNPDWNMALVEERVGVLKRHVARADETALDLAFQACKKLFSKHQDAKEQIDGIIFCTQSGDYILPPNSCILHSMLDLPENVFTFDFNLACSGYIYGLALAQGLASSGIAKNILLVNADTYSKYINKDDRSVRVLFGDGAAVSWITTAASGEGGIIDLKCFTHGKLYDKFIIPAGGCRIPKSVKTAIPKTDDRGNTRTAEEIHMDGMEILQFVNSKIPKQVKEILARAKLAINDIDLFIFHQASKLALDKLTDSLQINPKKVYRNLHRVGNTVSASIPMALKDALDDQSVSKGDKVLLSGFGVGLSSGSAIIEI